MSIDDLMSALVALKQVHDLTGAEPVVVWNCCTKGVALGDVLDVDETVTPGMTKGRPVAVLRIYDYHNQP
jgi:hypothetical protein